MMKYLLILISDSGDNPTAGGVGDVTVFLERAIALQLKPDDDGLC